VIVIGGLKNDNLRLPEQLWSKLTVIEKIVITQTGLEDLNSFIGMHSLMI